MSRPLSIFVAVGTLRTAALATAALPAGLAAQDSDTRRLALADYMDMETVAGPQISPEGSQVVYTRGWIDKEHDRRQSSLWIMNADGSKNRHLTEGSGARWSPDGTRNPVYPWGRGQRLPDLHTLDGRGGSREPDHEARARTL